MNFIGGCSVFNWFVCQKLSSLYMDEKGKNLATKEDIEEITRKTEEVQQEFREGFELFSNDVKFKYIQSSKEIIARKKKSIKHLSGRD